MADAHAPGTATRELALLGFLIVLIQRVDGVVLGLVFLAVASVALARQERRTIEMFKRLRWLLPAIFVSSAWSAPGEPIALWGIGSQFSVQGVGHGAALCARIGVIVAACVVLLDVQRPQALVAGMYNLARLFAPWNDLRLRRFAVRLGLTVSIAGGATEPPTRAQFTRLKNSEALLVYLLVASAIALTIL